MLLLAGTIPTVYMGVTYYTPIEVYIPLRYPHEPPMVFVKPTAGITPGRHGDV